MIWSTAQDENERQDQEANDSEHLDRRQPELNFAEEFDAKIINHDDCDQEDGNEDARVDLLSRYPILDDERGGSQLVWRDDDVCTTR